MDFGRAENQILIAPAPNWYCLGALSIEEWWEREKDENGAEKKRINGLYVYSTKNSLILGTVLENRILGSVYCGVKSKPIAVSVFRIPNSRDGPKTKAQGGTQGTAADENLVISSTHSDNRVRFWLLREKETQRKEEVDSAWKWHFEQSESLKKPPGLIQDNSGYLEKELQLDEPEESERKLGVRLLSDRVKCSERANSILHLEREVVVGDVTGEILFIDISGLLKGTRPEFQERRYRPIKREITSFSRLREHGRLAIGYKGGQVVILSIEDGGVLSLIEDEGGNLLRGGSINSMLDLEQEILLGVSKSICIFTCSKKSQEVSKKTIKEGVPSFRESRRSLQSQSRSTQFWTLLVSGVDNEGIYASQDGQIHELALDSQNNLEIVRSIAIGGFGGDLAGQNDVIFSIKGCKLGPVYYLLGITKSKRVFLLNTSEWRLEWVMNTLGGWIEDLVSPSGFSHIIYILSGDGNLMGLDLLDNHSSQRTPRIFNHSYGSFSHSSKDEVISRICLNPLLPEYLLYLTDLGRLGITYINPDNISHFLSIKLEVELPPDLLHCVEIGSGPPHLLKISESEDLEWLMLESQSKQEDLGPDAGFGPYPRVQNEGECLKAGTGVSNGNQVLNSQLKAFKSLVSGSGFRAAVVIFSSKTNRCSYSHLRPEFRKGELVFKAKMRSFTLGYKDAVGSLLQSQRILKLKRYAGPLGSHQKAIYFSSQIGDLELTGFQERSIQWNYSQAWPKGVPKGDDQRRKGSSSSSFIFKLGFSITQEDGELSLGLVERVELLDVFTRGNWESPPAGRPTTGGGAPEAILGGIVVSNKLGQGREIYLLTTNTGSLVVATSTQLIRVENVFKEKVKMDLKSICMSIIETPSTEDSKNGVSAFNLALTRDSNLTSIIRVKASEREKFLHAEILLIRPNTDHIASLSNKFNFRSHSIWYLDIRDSGGDSSDDSLKAPEKNFWKNGLKLLQGGQEQVLQVFDISRELKRKTKPLSINRGSLIFLTNKNLYQQNQQKSIQTLTLLLQFRLRESLIISGNSQEKGFWIREIKSFLAQTEESFSETGDSQEALLDLVMFLNYQDSSSDLMELHFEKHPKTEPFEEKNESHENTDLERKASKGGKISQGNELLVEYLDLLKRGHEHGSPTPILDSFLLRYSEVSNRPKLRSKFTSNVEMKQSVTSGHLLFEWVSYVQGRNTQSDSDLDLNLGAEEGLEPTFASFSSPGSSFEEECIFQALMIERLDRLQRELWSLKLRGVAGKESSILHPLDSQAGENPNVLHEYCILNVLLGRAHMALEMYCHYGLFQNAWLISNHFFGHRHILTLGVLEEWKEHLVSRDLTLQALKCLIACSDYRQMYSILARRIFSILELPNEGSLNQIDKLFQVWKLSGYLMILLDSTTPGSEDLEPVSSFSVDILNYILGIFLTREVNSQEGCKIIDLQEMLSLGELNVVIPGGDKLEGKMAMEGEGAIVNRLLDIENKVNKIIRLYGLLVRWCSLIVSSGGRIDVSALLKLLEDFRVRSRNELYIMIKKCSYLPFEDQLRFPEEEKVMRELLLFALNAMLEIESTNWILNIENLIKSIHADLISTKGTESTRKVKTNIFHLAFRALFDFLMANSDVAKLEEIGLGEISNITGIKDSGGLKELRKAGIFGGCSSPISSNLGKIRYSEEFMENKYKKLKLDLYILGIYIRMNSEPSNPVSEQNGIDSEASPSSRPLNCVALENLEKFILGDHPALRELYIGEAESTYSSSIFELDREVSLVWLCHKLKTFASSGVTSDLAMEAKRVAQIIKKSHKTLKKKTKE
ncbi:WD40-repeat containing protein [Cryptosporidium felis]|nr:WD40-repeat containing protein [Cryptosporidium felis]